MAKNTNSPQVTEKSLELPRNLNEAQIAFVTQKTPKQFIKNRPAAGGQVLRYVEVGYVISILNKAFGWDWDYQVLDQQIGKKQV